MSSKVWKRLSFPLARVTDGGLLRKHHKLFFFNGTVLLLCLIVLVLAFNHERSPIYEVDSEDELVVILDIGHGGHDPGAVVPVVQPDGSRTLVREHALVFDVGARLARLLDANAGISVLPLLTEASGRLPVSELSVPLNPSRTVLRTTPLFDLGMHEQTLAVNMRWFLANAYWAHLMQGRSDFRRVVFLSLHMDLVPSRPGGLTIYVPSGPPLQPSGLQLEPYARFAEVRDWLQRDRSKGPALDDMVESTRLAQAIVRSFGRLGLPVAPDRTVRNSIHLGDQSYVPAVLRFNEIPTRLLLELVNLAVPHDRTLVLNPAYREKIATAVHEGLLEYLRELQAGDIL